MKVYGGNSGYVGYSESKRSYNAKQDGRYPKTMFKEVYGLSEKSFKTLLERGVIFVSEWHHTSKYGNKTKFYDINNLPLFYYLIGQKDYAFCLYKKTRDYSYPIDYSNNIKSVKNLILLYSVVSELHIGAKIGDIIDYKKQKFIVTSLTKHRKLPNLRILTQKDLVD